MRRTGAGRELIGGKWREKHKEQSRADEDKHKTGVEERSGGKNKGKAGKCRTGGENTQEGNTEQEGNTGPTKT